MRVHPKHAVVAGGVVRVDPIVLELGLALLELGRLIRPRALPLELAPRVAQLHHLCAKQRQEEETYLGEGQARAEAQAGRGEGVITCAPWKRPLRMHRACNTV